MTLYLIRHAESLGNTDRLAYGRLGDANVPLTDDGWQQAVAAGKFFADYLNWAGQETWPQLWSSSYMRPRQTLSGLLHGMKGGHALRGEPRLFEDINLIEQSYGWLPYTLDGAKGERLRDLPQEDVAAFGRVLHAFSKTVHGHTSFTAQPPMGESPLTLSLRVRDFMSTLRRDLDAGKKDHIIVTHGATIKAFMLRAFHLPMKDWDALATPGNADIFRIDQHPVRGQLLGIRRIYDGQSGLAVDTNPIEGLRPLGIDDLPELPLHTLKKG